MQVTMSEITLPPLPYPYSALEPWIDARTMRLHYDVHHRRGVESLRALAGQLAALQAEDLATQHRLQGLAARRLAEHRLHCLFWEVMAPNQGGRPRDELAEQITEDFGSFADFRTRFSLAANGLGEGGWAALAWSAQLSSLQVATGRNSDFLGGLEALLVLDLRAHAYFPRYGTRRTEYIHNWWNTVNWPRVAQHFRAALNAGSVPDGTETPRKVSSCPALR
jgi:Fe-Mn family superoxide dismutase